MPGKKPTPTPIVAGPPPKSEFELDLDARIAKAKAGITTASAPLGETPEETPPAEPEVALPPSEAPTLGELTDESPAPAPEPETPPATEPPAETPAAAAPAEPVKPEPTKENTGKWSEEDWRRYRANERENKRLKRELEALKAAKVAETPPATAEQPAPAATPTDDDPFGIEATKRALEAAQADNAKTRQEMEQDRLRTQIDRDETAFKAQHPDYDQAVGHMVNFEYKRYWLAGSAVAADRFLRDNKMRPAIEDVADRFVKIEDAAAPLGWRAVERDKTNVAGQELSDSEAARLIATDMYISERRNDLIASARISNRSIAEVAYETSQLMGYQPQAMPAANGASPAAPAAQTPAEKIRAQAKITAASKTLSATSSTGPAEAPPQQFRTLAELMAFRQRDPQGFRAYADKMEKTVGPQWHHRLAG